MVNRIKGITVEIGEYTTKLQNALKKVNTEIKHTQLELRDVNKLLKMDPGNTDLLNLLNPTRVNRTLGAQYQD